MRIEVGVSFELTYLYLIPSLERTGSFSDRGSRIASSFQHTKRYIGT